MTSTTPPNPSRKSLIGHAPNFWLHHSTHGFDLTHPPSPSTPITTPRLTLQTTSVPITIDPAKSALVIIDMQNFFLSEALGRVRGAGHAACEKLVEYAIPAARKAGMRVVWLNWGLTQEDLSTMPPGVTRCFGFYSVPHDQDFGEDDGLSIAAPGANAVGVDRFGKERAGYGKDAMYHGLGASMGPITLEDGEEVDAGNLLYLDSWNADIYPPLKALVSPSDALISKNRMSGLWGSETPFQKFLEEQGVKTLLFAGINTDQCVGGTLTDAFSRGYDCVLLRDGCGTTSPEEAQRSWEWNAERSYGFCTSCEEAAVGVGKMEGKE
ncbi:isochorismatase family protein [Bimuria novae-zelandiae CBS 107.79]|uniref:Isochorismatase family protein n=1 Tax=Bimuria novae-zelandiae CBS 107.79 TaxID=1447943 RepID=A0A6A5VGK8_9PLEO|nr:isochorismatase family protein [Bimuria novae-zelandiae CBS 107.79]